MSNQRLVREAEFHDRAFSQRTRAAASGFYAVAEAAKQHYRSLLLDGCAGLRVLEYGCGTGSCAFALAARGARVSGIDISRTGIGLARQEARRRGLSPWPDFRVMDAERLGFAPASFDLVCGSGILHHLGLQEAVSELSRVLRPAGRAVFFEPMGHNTLINLYRRLTPHLRSADEHPLRRADLHLLSTRFRRCDLRPYVLCSLLAIPFRGRPGFHRLLRVLEQADRLLLAVPGLRHQAWIVVAQLAGPRGPGDLAPPPAPDRSGRA